MSDEYDDKLDPKIKEKIVQLKADYAERCSRDEKFKEWAEENGYSEHTFDEEFVREGNTWATINNAYNKVAEQDGEDNGEKSDFKDYPGQDYDKPQEEDSQIAEYDGQVPSGRDDEGDDAPWKLELTRELRLFAKQTNREGSFETNPENGLYVTMDDTVFHYTKKGERLSFGSKDGKTVPSQQDFDKAVELTKGLPVTFGHIRTDEYKAKLMISCIKFGNEMQHAPDFGELSESVQKKYQSAYEEALRNSKKAPKPERSAPKEDNVVSEKISEAKKRLMTKEVLTGDRFEGESLEGKSPLKTAVETGPKKTEKGIQGISPLSSTKDKQSTNEVFKAWINEGLNKSK